MNADQARGSLIWKLAAGLLLGVALTHGTQCLQRSGGAAAAVSPGSSEPLRDAPAALETPSGDDQRLQAFLRPIDSGLRK